MSTYIASVLASVEAKNPGEAEFIQAVREVYGTLAPVVAGHPEYHDSKILERMAEPERVIMLITDAPENPYSALKFVCSTLNSSIASGDGT